MTIKYVLKFTYSEKATKFGEVFPLLLTVCTVCNGKISQNFVAFSENMTFIKIDIREIGKRKKFNSQMSIITTSIGWNWNAAVLVERNRPHLQRYTHTGHTS